MDIEGTYTLQAAPEDVESCLGDVQMLRRAIPGMERLEPLGENAYAVTLHVRQAPLIGTYVGQAVVSGKQPYEYFITAEGEGRQGKFHIEWIVRLSRLNENTVVSYRGSVKPGKQGALLPAPLVKGAIKLLFQQFFTLVAEQLRAMNYAYTFEMDEVNGVPVLEAAEDAINGVLTGEDVLLASGAQSGGLLGVVRRLGLGSGDPIDEERWVNRVRRAGTISALLLLVWVGTRLPRRLSSFTK